MKIFNKITILLLIIVVLVSCDSDKEASNTIDKVSKEDHILQREFYTKDGRTQFIIHNEPNLNKNRIDNITKEIHHSYQEILNYKNKDYDWEKNINIYLKAQDSISEARKDHIILYNTRGGNYLLTHELTHILLGYGNTKKSEFNAEYGYLTQEGFAVYLEEKVNPNKFTFPNNGINVHKIMKYLKETNQDIPLRELVNNDNQKYFSSEDGHMMWRSYVHAGSFIRYLFETYEKDKVLKIYNNPSLENNFGTIFNKDIYTVESEWLNFIKYKIQPLTSNEKGKLLYP